MPDEKADKIKWLQNLIHDSYPNGTVAFVGDGINDSIGMYYHDVFILNSIVFIF